MSVLTESCYDCGGDIPNGLGEPRLAQLRELPGAATDAWGWVKLCPTCGRRRQRRRLAVLALVSLFVGALTLVVAYPLLS
jgi:hypothetical protein